MLSKFNRYTAYHAVLINNKKILNNFTHQPVARREIILLVEYVAATFYSIFLLVEKTLTHWYKNIDHCISHYDRAY